MKCRLRGYMEAVGKGNRNISPSLSLFLSFVSTIIIRWLEADRNGVKWKEIGGGGK